MKIVILYSGGLDSLIMNHLAKMKHPEADVKLVYYDIGQPYNHKEIKSLPKEVEVRTVGWLKQDTSLKSKEGSKTGNIMIPGRNMTLATLVASTDLPDEIWMGALLGETHKNATDKNYKFLEEINNLLSYVMSPYEKQPKVVFPLADSGFGKFEAVEWAFFSGISKETLMNTSSCLSGVKGKCGECAVCTRRWGIFNQLGFEEKYNKHPMVSKQSLEMILEMLRYYTKGESYYDEYRRREVIPAAMKYWALEATEYSELEQLIRMDLTL